MRRVRLRFQVETLARLQRGKGRAFKVAAMGWSKGSQFPEQVFKAREGRTDRQSDTHGRACACEHTHIHTQINK